MVTQSYIDYYDRTIQQHKTGLKLVLGGTGLGKTSGILEVLARSDTQGRKLIYIANRLQLTQELEDEIKKRGFNFARIFSNSETLIKIIFTEGLWQEIITLLNSNLIETIVQTYHRKNSSRQVDANRILKDLNSLHGMNPKKLQLSDHKDNPNINLINGIIGFFQTILKTAQNMGEDIYDSVLAFTVIHELFPYIRFKPDPHTAILLITIQKAFVGFFDGKENLNLTKLHGNNGNFIIFLDEYDFLEYELTKLICRSRHIKEPFRFIEDFYREMKRHRLVRADYPAPAAMPNNLRDRVLSIVNLVDELDINYPQINQFTAQGEERKGVVFQTSRTLIHDRLYLRETNRSFEIVKENKSEANYVDVLVFFKTIHKAMFRILALLLELKDEHPNIYAEIMRQVYRTSDFRREIEHITQFPRKHTEAQQTQFDNLLEEGYGMYEIHELNQLTDPSEVEFRYYSIYTTPEKIVATLAKDNLVFGLSATADMLRIVRNFSDIWFQKQAEEGFLNYIPVTEEDYEIIHSLNQDKKNSRGNTITVLEAEELDSRKHKKIWDYVQSISKLPFLKGNEYKKCRIAYFFTSLVWITENYPANPETLQSHILFYNTFSEVEKLFEDTASSNNEWFKTNVYSNEKLPSTYNLEFFGQRFFIVFYNALNAKKIQHKDLKPYFNELFWQNIPVLIVTQYPSAGNGVNIQYLPREGATEEIDLLNIHLLDAPYFYFNRREDGSQYSYSEWVEKIKENIWYLAKLFESGYISYTRFRTALEELHSGDFNQEYMLSPQTQRDVVSNQMATFIQALGRIERSRKPTPNQRAILGKEVWKIFRRFTTHPQFNDLFAEKLKTASNNLLEIFQQIIDQTSIDAEYNEIYKEERLAARNYENRLKIKNLLERLSDLRAGAPEDIEARQDWEVFRKVALRHDFHDISLKKYAGTFRADFNHFRNGKMFINKSLEIIPYEKSGSEECEEWNIDSIYYLIRQNPIISRFFINQGYELGFNNTIQQFFTPYFHTAILSGAIGEEAIRAILSHLGIVLADSIDNHLFELTDLKLSERAWYVDCKNYSQRTLKYFPIEDNDPAWRPKLNDQDFTKSATGKLQRIQEFHERDDCKSIYLNLASHEDWKGNYRDADFSPVKTFTEAKFVIIPGVINRNNPSYFTETFEKFIEQLKHQL